MPPPVAVTMGEPAGIGGEITLKAWLRRSENLPAFFAIDDPSRLQALARRLGWDVPVVAVDSAADATAVFDRALPVLTQPLAESVEPGRPAIANAASIRASIARAVELAQDGQASAMVTNPIHKGVMYQGGFHFPGHTEFLAHLVECQGDEVMMLACRTLRVVPVTIHVGLAEAIRTLTSDAIVAAGLATDEALRRDFAIANPRLAVAGLNPHAGEDGAMGREEIDIIAPAVAELRAAGVDATGPLPPDTMFHAAARAGYDAALCMYHDQALIPLKTLGFDEGVNVTLGLPIVRTSPDHGTAFAIAGTGQANETSLMEALRLAATIAANRQGHAP
ncbi:4-hydroxythreonine-4-phosphate dehydrogenase PdxA [Magnetospirillum aberrantis SpK]|uniref:4-hydroxythreonine-4-phosphate dehydrogenase n=2 Tax=Magnetospirillum TaxID=13134 RepID=A0A7C9UZ69_9PROT|nr:4-hydroxythreonine-4-phosphate dehydrogenase PdxA [Magnetospirillum aberrantis SpK]